MYIWVCVFSYMYIQITYIYMFVCVYIFSYKCILMCILALSLSLFVTHVFGSLGGWSQPASGFEAGRDYPNSIKLPKAGLKDFPPSNVGMIFPNRCGETINQSPCFVDWKWGLSKKEKKAWPRRNGLIGDFDKWGIWGIPNVYMNELGVHPVLGDLPMVGNGWFALRRVNR